MSLRTDLCGIGGLGRSKQLLNCKTLKGKSRTTHPYVLSIAVLSSVPDCRLHFSSLGPASGQASAEILQRVTDSVSQLEKVS